MINRIFAVLLASMFAYASNAQALTVTTTNNANTLANNIMGSGITLVGSATYSGAAGASGTFTNGGNIGIDSGILLTTGRATGAQGPNNNTAYTVSNNAAGLSSLNNLISGYTTKDAAQLSFDFTTSGGNLFFDYVFASEEYNEWVDSDYNDVFAFFLDGKNIALIPGTTTPVSINTVNLGYNPAFYRNNSPGSYDTQYDGLTTVLTATVLGLGSGQHHIDIAIADAGDFALDSGVFIKGGSFSDTYQNTPVPEPGTMMLLGVGMAGLAIYGKRRKNNKV